MTSDSPTDSTWMFAVLLVAHGDGWRVWSADFKASGVSHHMRFTDQNRLIDVFQPGVADILQTLSDDVAATDGVSLSQPDFLFESGACLLKGARLLEGRDKDGRQMVTLRFKYFVGNLDDLIKLSTAITAPSLHHRERIAVEALADVASPLLRLATITQHRALSVSQKSAVETQLAMIEDRAAELQFHLGMLTRYVRQCSEALAAEDQPKARNRVMAAGERQSRLSAVLAQLDR